MYEHIAIRIFHYIFVGISAINLKLSLRSPILYIVKITSKISLSV